MAEEQSARDRAQWIIRDYEIGAVEEYQLVDALAAAIEVENAEAAYAYALGDPGSGPLNERDAGAEVFTQIIKLRGFLSALRGSHDG